MNFLAESAQMVIWQGRLGVNLFFVLSGFILTFTYYKRTGIVSQANGYREFMMKRMARIYPVYAFGLLLFLIVCLVMNDFHQHFSAVFLLDLLMLQSYIPDLSLEGFGGGGWSVSTEFFFYAAFPLLLPVLLRIRSKRANMGLLAIVALLSAAPGYAYYFSGMSDNALSVYSFPPARLPEFVCGMLTALLVFRFDWKVKPAAAIVGLGITVAYLAIFGEKLRPVVAHNLVVVPAIVLLLAALARNNGGAMFQWLASRPMVYLGKVSYSFYIIQIPMSAVYDFLLKTNAIHANDFYHVGSWLVMNLGISIAAYEWIEKPAHKYLTDRKKDDSVSTARPRLARVRFISQGSSDNGGRKGAGLSLRPAHTILF